jgi:hypothetical protein
MCGVMPSLPHISAQLNANEAQGLFYLYQHLLPWELMGYILSYVVRINYAIKGNGESSVYFDCSLAVPANIFDTWINSKKQLATNEYKFFHSAWPLTSPSFRSTLIAHAQLPAQGHWWVPMPILCGPTTHNHSRGLLQRLNMNLIL